MNATDARTSASLNRNMGNAILAGIALEVLRKGPSLPAPIQFVRGIEYHEVPPAYVVDAAMKKDAHHG